MVQGNIEVSRHRVKRKQKALIKTPKKMNSVLRKGEIKDFRLINVSYCIPHGTPLVAIMLGSHMKFFLFQNSGDL